MTQPYFCQFCIQACSSTLVGFTCLLCKTDFIGYPILYAYVIDDKYHLYYHIQTKTVTVSNYLKIFNSPDILIPLNTPICSITLDHPLNLINKQDIIQKIDSLKAFQ